MGSRIGKNTLGLLALALVLVACGKHTPPPPEEDLLYRVECINQAYPDSALRILDSLDFSVLSKKEHAHYCLIKALVCFNLRKNQVQADSLLEIAKHYYLGSSDKYYESLTYSVISDRAELTNQGEQIVLDNRLKALQCIEQCQHIDERLVRYAISTNNEQNIIDRLKYAIQLRIGKSYSENGYYREALGYLKASEAFFACQENCLFLHNITANKLAFNYLKMNVFDSCLMYYKKGLLSAEAANSIEDCAYYHSCIANYCLYRFETQQYVDDTESQSLLEQSVSECREGLHLLDINDRKAHNMRYDLYDKLSHTYFNLQEFDSCIKYSNLALELIERSKQCLPYELKTRLYNAYRAVGDEESAVQLADFLVNRGTGEAEEQKAVAEVKNEYDRKLELQQLESEQQLKRYRLYLWIALLVIGLMAALWMSFRHRKNKEIETMKLRKAQQQQALLVYQSGQKDALQRILEIFESAYPHAIEKTRSAYPELNDSEYHVALLTFFGFRAKEVADLLGLTENTALKYRSNIRKKVGNNPFSNFV